jgi:hypothetical protein
MHRNPQGSYRLWTKAANLLKHKEWAKPPARCSQADAARVGVAPVRRAGRSTVHLAPFAVYSTSGQAVTCSAHTVAGTTPTGSAARCAGASMKGKTAVGADAAAAPRWVGQETQPGGAPALGNAASGPHAQPAKPPDCACGPLPRTGQEMRQATAFIRQLGKSGSCLGLYQADRHPGAARQCTTMCPGPFSRSAIAGGQSHGGWRGCATLPGRAPIRWGVCHIPRDVSGGEFQAGVSARIEHFGRDPWRHKPLLSAAGAVGVSRSPWHG